MISLRRPSKQVISKFLEAQSRQGFSYPDVGSTASLPPAGYQVDQTRIKLGKGERVFDEARAALGRWDQFRLGWVETFPTAVPIQVGEVVAVVAGVGRRTIHDRMGSLDRRSLVRHPGLLTTAVVADSPGISLRSSRPEAIRPRIGRGDGQGGPGCSGSARQETFGALSLEKLV
jgi:hypothetical protein